MKCWTRSQTLHNLSAKNAREASEALEGFIRSCHAATSDERDLMAAYHDIARFVIHASMEDLSSWVEGNKKKLAGGDKNRFALLCKLLLLCTYDPKKEELLEACKTSVDHNAPVEAMMVRVTPRANIEFYVRNFRISHPGPVDAFNQIGQSGHA